MTNFDYEALSNRLSSHGWIVEMETRSYSLPSELLLRYEWIPPDLRGFLEHTASLATSDDKTWFLTAREMSAANDSAFNWNQWELDSLDVASEDTQWKATISEFWDNHLPIVMSVRDGYKYLAIRKSDLGIVGGNEPEFEETEKVADSFEDLMAMLGDGKECRYI